MNLLKKAFLTLSAVVLLAFSATALIGCGQSGEEVIREALTKELEGIKTCDEATIGTLAASSGADVFDQVGVDPKEFYVSFLEGFDYSIGDVSVEGDKATASVTLTCRDFTEITKVFMEKVETFSPDGAAALDTDALNKQIGQLLTESVGEVSANEKPAVELTYTKQGNTWAPTAEAERTIANSLMSQ